MTTTVNIRQDNLSANTKTGNLLANTDLAFASEDGIINIYGVVSASGVNIEVGVGSEKAISDREILMIGTTISKSDHLIATFEVAEKEPISIFLREVAGAATSDAILIIEHIGVSEM